MRPSRMTKGKATAPPKLLQHYTSVPNLLKILRGKKLVLGDPSRWIDKNDAFLIEEYRKQNDIPKIFALCFCMENEISLFWETYAKGENGCRIDFVPKILLKVCKVSTNVRADGRFRKGKVSYLTLKRVQRRSCQIEDFPFIKRHPFRNEHEYRILWEGKTRLKSIGVEIDLGSIHRITLSARMPAHKRERLRRSLSLLLPRKVKVCTTTLYINERWINAFKRMHNKQVGQ